MLSNQKIFFTTPSFVAGIFFLNLRPLINKLFVTQYFSSSEIVLLGTVSLILFIPECLVLSISYSIQSLTSRFSEKAYNFDFLFSGFLTTMLMMIPILIIIGLYPAFFLRLVSQKAPIDPASLNFFILSLIASFFQCLIFCLRGFYSAYRNNQIFFSVIIISLVIDSLLNQIFLSGIGLFSPMTIEGMGLSYCIATFFALIIYLDQFFKDMRILNPTLPKSSRHTQLLKRAIPLSIHGIFDHIGTTFIFSCVSSNFGLIPLASLHLISSMQGISPGAGFGLTALTEVSKAHTKSASLSLRVGERILSSGCFLLGLIGFLVCLNTKMILSVVAPYDPQLQSCAFHLMKLSFGGLFLHVGCQIMLKILQAIDKTVQSISINLGFIYFFRIPLLICIPMISNASIKTVMLVLLSEKLLKLLAMFVYWQIILQKQIHQPEFGQKKFI